MYNNNNNYNYMPNMNMGNMRMPYSQNNYNPYQYQQMQTPSPVSLQSQNNNNAQNNLIWVMGKENARSMQLQPNSSIIMLDSEANKFYIKTTDDIGLGKLRVYTYQEEQDNAAAPAQTQIEPVDLSAYVTKEELNNALLSLKENKFNEQSIPTTKSTTSHLEF